MNLGNQTGRQILVLLSVLLISGACVRTPAQKEARFLETGKALLAKKDYTRAALQFRNASQLMPQDAEPYYQLAVVYLEMREPQSALKLLRKAVELNPKHAAAQLKLAAFELGSANSKIAQDAQERVRQVLSDAPDNPDAREMLAITELRLGKFDEALRDLQQSMDKSPQHLRSAFTLAKLKLMQNDLAGAEAVLKKAAQGAPKSPDPALALAALYLRAGKKSEAEAQVRHAVQLDPKNASGLLLLAAFQTNAGQTSESEQTYRRISALPDKSLKHLHAVFLFQQGRREEAIGELAKLAKDNPDDRNFRGMLVSAYAIAGRPADAQLVLDQALKRNPKDIDALLQRSSFYLDSGRLKEVEDDLHSVLHFRPDSAEAHYGLARVYGLRGISPSQRQELTEALRLNPRLLAARMDLAKSFLTAKDARAALELLNQTPDAQKKAPAYIVGRNWALMALDNTTELRKSIDQGLAVTRAPELRYQDALLRLNEKDYVGARTVLEDLMKEYPESSSSLDLLAQTYAVQGNMAKALEVVNDYSWRQPKSAYLKYSLGIWRLKAKQKGLARQAFAEAMAANPNYIAPALMLSEMDLSDGSLDRARRTLKEVLSHHPDNIRATFLLGLAEDQAGNHTGAAECYRAVLERDSSNQEALNNLACDLAIDHPDEALKYAQQALEKAPEDPALQDTIGWVYYRKGVYPTALNYLKLAVAKEATAVRRYHLALAYAKLGERSEAQKNLAAALKLDPKVATSLAIEQ